MQPLRIENLAVRLSENDGYVHLTDSTKAVYVEQAKEYAAILLGSEPVITVEHGVRSRVGGHVTGHIYGPFKVPQYTSLGQRPMIREKWVYAAGTFYTNWEEV